MQHINQNFAVLLEDHGKQPSSTHCETEFSHYETNRWGASDLTLNVMWRCARAINADLNDDKISEILYWICCDLDDYPEDQGFGSSDSTPYILDTERIFHIPATDPYRANNCMCFNPCGRNKTCVRPVSW